jgi:hypothetical protein
VGAYILKAPRQNKIQLAGIKKASASGFDVPFWYGIPLYLTEHAEFAFGSAGKICAPGGL